VSAGHGSGEWRLIFIPLFGVADMGEVVCSGMTLIDKRLPEFMDQDLFTITFQSNPGRNTVKQGGLLLTVSFLSGNSQRFIGPSNDIRLLQ
jgi:hypothetical protein